jgi:hypothetical protein
MRTLTALRSATCAAVLIFGASACSGGDDGEEATSLTASQVCASTLDSSAAAALQRIGGTEKFTELPGTNDSGEPNKFSLKRAASTIHQDKTRRNQCFVFKAEDESGQPLILVDFSATKYDPTEDAPATDAGSGQTIYPFGVHAQTNDNSSALLYFECSTRGSGTATPHIRASLTSAPGQIAAKTTGRDLMIVLNAISRGMAKQLGCVSQAALPSEVPEAKDS